MIRIRLDKFLQPQGSVVAFALAKKTGLSYTTLHELKTGEKKVIKSDNLDKIITALRELTGKDITPNDLLEYVDDEPKEQVVAKKAKRKK
ncbi:MAG: helix-turn-helix domain-containing protein [Trueperaceae bacterium]